MDDWVAAILEEYKTLRTESLQAIEQMQRTLQIGLVAIGVITRLDQLRRGVYAGAHCALIEHRLAEHFRPKAPPLTWETQIQTEYDEGGR
jgi:hypothetical protein